MRTISYSFALLLVLLAVTQLHGPAAACGGFFCSSSPVDQSAERIIFAINPDGSTDMIVQIAYQGDSKDFAWLLPLASVPDPDKLATFPELAMTTLDTGTAPLFTRPANCFGGGFAGGGGGPGGTTAGASAGSADAGVSVYIRKTVGPYDVAVIGSEDASATYQWLLDNGYRITSAMNEFVKLYTDEKMKFLALKLTDTADVSEVQPFRLRLPGDSPSIPLRLTSIAALPEMGIVVWIFGDQRFEPAGDAQEVEIPKEDLRWDPRYFFGGLSGTNWYTLVAHAADKAQGKAWVVEQASSTSNLLSLITSQSLSPQDPRFDAQQALMQLINGHSYVTRLYTRLSPEEMTYDPLFKRSMKGDVQRVRELPYVPELCDQNSQNDAIAPCDFNPCGALALCRNVKDDDGQPVASCACAPGLTARAVPASGATITATISCIDERLSFLNVGDKSPSGDTLPDPCVDRDCGEHGKCVNMNMTATCECEAGYVARARGQSQMALTCVKPSVSIPDSFYGLRMPERELPTGRDVHVVEVERPSSPSSSSCSAARPARSSGGALAVTTLALALAVLVRRQRKTGA